jgi:hypothetical protein
VDSIAAADNALAELVDACGGLSQFLEDHAVIVVADHAQTDVHRELDLAAELGSEWRVLEPNQSDPERAELAVSPTARAAAVYVIAGKRSKAAHADVRERLRKLEGVDLFAWLEHEGEPVLRGNVDGPPPRRSEAVVERDGKVLRFRPGSTVVDARGERWEVEGDLEALAGEITGSQSRFDSADYPDALGRLYAALCAPHAGDVVISASPGFEFVDWGGMSHCPGGSHGALDAGDSLGPLLLYGFEDGIERRREQWAISDVADLVLEHFEAEAPARELATSGAKDGS